MIITPTPIQDLCIIEPRVFVDDRGWFFESYNADAFRDNGMLATFTQDNHSSSRAGVLRGLHFQLPPKAMIKIVRCTRGRIWDVAVDLRKNSLTYRQWFGVELSAENKKMLYIPAGFAHGFYAFEDCDVVYKCSATFDSSLDGGIAWNDSEIAIQWPITDTHAIILSEKDAHLPKLADLALPF